MEAINNQVVAQIKKHYLAMGHEKLFVEEIKDLLNFNSKDYGRLISKKRYQDTLAECKAEEVMEKYAILSYLVSSDFYAGMRMGVNYFDHTIFSELFKKKSLEWQVQQMIPLENLWRERIYQLVNMQIEKIYVDTIEVPERKSKCR